MFYRYEIKNNGKEEILYLYLTMSYEFSKELGLKADDKEELLILLKIIVLILMEIRFI